MTIHWSDDELLAKLQGPIDDGDVIAAGDWNIGLDVAGLRGIFRELIDLRVEHAAVRNALHLQPGERICGDLHLYSNDRCLLAKHRSDTVHRGQRYYWHDEDNVPPGTTTPEPPSNG
jgi:hypothetical protein